MTTPFIRACSLVFGITLVTLSVGLAPMALAADSSAELRALTGAQTRVVWIQDAVEIACLYSERPTLRLMGLDTDDGKGERALIPAIGRYWRPGISDDGSQVMFGDLDKKTVNVVNWDGSGLRTVLENAHFEDVWTDPKDGVTWFYAKVAEQRAGATVDVIRRYRLDNPKVNELIWDKTPIHSFMVNGDGKAASGGVSEGGNTPQGIFTLPNGEFHARAGGCWPSMSPDNSLRSWVFTGNHRSIHFAVTTSSSGKGYTYGVEFNKSPGLTVSGREELYHPRWSNDVRFFAATAPLSEWSYRAEAKIPPHVAEKVEIYLGKFSADMKSVERWVKISNNRHGDYFPNAWVRQPAGPPAWLASAPAITEDSAPKGKLDPTAQVFLWTTGSDSNQLTDAKTGAIRQCLGQFRGDARYERFSVMDLTGGSFAPDATAQPWLDAVKTGGAFAVEAVLTPQTTPPSGEGAVLAFADEIESGNVVLSQRDDVLSLRLRGLASPLPLVRLPRGQASHVIVSYAPGKLGVYVDGQRVLLANPPSVPVSGWTAQALMLGDLSRGGRNWPGLMEGVGLFGREIGAGEARQRFDASQERRAGRKATVERMNVEAKLTGTCPPADPLGIAPYKRCFSVQQFEVVKIIEGKLTDKVISVAQWSVLDGKVVPEYLTYKAGQTYRLVLEQWSDHPEQESERMISGDFEEGSLFYQVRETAVAVTPATATAPAGDTADTPWRPVAGQANQRRLDGPVFIRGQNKPRLFVAEPGVTLDTAGQDVVFENGSMPEIVNNGALRLGGSGAVATVTVVDGGSGYTAAPAVKLSGGGGQGASAVATMALADLKLERLGSGYGSAPTVVIGAPDIYGGRQATAVAELDKGNGALSRLRITQAGSGYTRPPRITFEGGGGAGAEATAILAVADVFVTNGGAGYTTPPVALLAGDGEGALVQAGLQRTLLRYTDAGGGALIKNTGTIDQDGAALLYDWAAAQNNNGNRGLENTGTWVMRNGAVLQFGSSTGRPFWGNQISNAGTLRLVGGARIGLQGLGNTGILQLGDGVVLGHINYAASDGAFSNAGQVQVAGSTAKAPVLFGLVHPERTGKRTVENGKADGTAKARFTLGTGRDASVFQVTGGEVEFTNQPGAALLIQTGATLALLTNDNGSRHLFNSRQAKLTNRGDLLLAGRLQVQGNQVGFMGISNQGRLVIQGDQGGVERFPNSAGPGSLYKLDYNPTQVMNLAGGTVQGEGTFTYVNSTGNAEARYLKLTNLGGISPGGEQPGRLTFANVNIQFGATAVPPADGKKGPPSLEGAGLLRIQINGPASFSSLRLTGEGDSGRLELVAGSANTLNVVTAGGSAPHGKFRIVTATAVKGTFATLQLNGTASAAYTVNYLPDGIDVVFP